MSMELIGVDVDLKRCHAWSSVRGRLCSNVGLNEALNAVDQDYKAALYKIILVECASPHIYGMQKSALYNKLRWVIWNSYALRAFQVSFDDSDYKVLCSPSSTWKHGMDAKTIHSVLDITGDNKDIRECRAMVEMYKKHPEDWKTVEEYMNGL